MGVNPPGDGWEGCGDEEKLFQGKCLSRKRKAWYGQNHDPMLNTPFKGYLNFIQQVEVDYGEYLSSNEKTQSRITVLVHAK